MFEFTLRAERVLVKFLYEFVLEMRTVFVS